MQVQGKSCWQLQQRMTTPALHAVISPVASASCHARCCRAQPQSTTKQLGLALSSTAAPHLGLVGVWAVGRHQQHPPAAAQVQHHPLLAETLQEGVYVSVIALHC
jgi:hypothetical protein